MHNRVITSFCATQGVEPTVRTGGLFYMKYLFKSLVSIGIMFIFLIIGLLLGALVLIFAVQNIAVVNVVFLTWQFEGSLALIVVLSIAVGMLLSWFLSLPNIFNKQARISKLKREKDTLKDEVEYKKIEVEKTKMEVENEKAKLSATNAYIDGLEKRPRI